MTLGVERPPAALARIFVSRLDYRAPSDRSKLPTVATVFTRTCTFCFSWGSRIFSAPGATAFSPIWQDACLKSGLPRPSDEHGCRVDDGSRAASYASKWGLESELTKSHTKQGKNGSRTPWDFLRAFLGKSEGWEQSAHLFRTYAQTFKGRRQLYWSNGLRDSLALAEQATDEEIAAIQEDNAQYLGEITDEQWRAILFMKSESAVLDMAEQHPEALPTMLEAIVTSWNRRIMEIGVPVTLPKHEACTGSPGL